ncbi:MAG: histone deacetylase [Candidatus Thorarchaeota archaeon]
MNTEIIFHELFTKHVLSPGHPESPERLVVALNQIREAGIIDGQQVDIVSTEPADLDEIVPLHDRSYIEQIRQKSEKGGGYFTLDTSVNSYTYDAALFAAGAGITAVDHVVKGESKNAFVLCRPPGHHAERDRAFGFCFINNIAVAAQHLIAKYGIHRILIVDYDAHHGNGTQNAFYDRSDVLYIGLHQDGRTLFPGSGFPNEIGSGTGVGYNINLSMYPGAGDVSFTMAFDDVVIPVAESFKPEFILVSSGFDAHYIDPLTNLGLTTSGYAMMNARLREIAERYAKGHLVYFLEGGYDLDVMKMTSQNLVEELSGNPVTSFGDSHTESSICTNYTKELISVLRDTLEGIHF